MTRGLIAIVVGAALLVVGALAGIAYQKGRSGDDHGDEVFVESEPDWLIEAREVAMPHRRFITLPLNNPDVVPAAEATHMRPDDTVVGVVVGDNARAYPWWILANFHMANDTIDGEPVFVSMCEVCSGGAAFSPLIEELPNRPLAFQICGVRNATLDVCDYETHSRWQPFAGIAHAGPLKGRELKRFPAFLESWEEWVKLYPHTDVLLGSDLMRARPHGAAAGEVGMTGIPVLFRDTANLKDARLRYHELVFGLIGEGEEYSIAYPIEPIREAGGVLEDELEGTPIVIVLQGRYRIAAYSRLVGGEAREFEVASRDPLVLVDQRGERWNELGQPLEGNTAEGGLEQLSGYLTEWYEWVTSYPETEIADVESLTR